MGASTNRGCAQRPIVVAHTCLVRAAGDEAVSNYGNQKSNEELLASFGSGTPPPLCLPAAASCSCSLLPPLLPSATLRSSLPCPARCLLVACLPAVFALRTTRSYPQLWPLPALLTAVCSPAGHSFAIKGNPADRLVLLLKIGDNVPPPPLGISW